MIQGFNFFAQGARTTMRKDVRPFVFLPAIVSLAIIAGGLTLGFSYINDLSNYLISSLPGWMSFLEWILQPLLYLLGLLVGAWSFGFLATIIGSPFLGDLALKVDNMPDPQIAWYKQIMPALGRELRKLRYHIPRLLLLLLLSVIPVVNTLAPFLWVAFGAWLMAVQFCDYTNENRQLPFEATLVTLQANKAKALGFGACVTLAMAVPLANFLVAPIAVAGGTLLMKSIRENSNV
jgi:CysZ protein